MTHRRKPPHPYDPRSPKNKPGQRGRPAHPARGGDEQRKRRPDQRPDPTRDTRRDPGRSPGQLDMSRPPVRKPRPPLTTGNPPKRPLPPRAPDFAPVPKAPSSEWEDEYADYIGDDVPELGMGSRMVPPEVRYEAEPEPAPAIKPISPVDFEAQIRTLEARLDGLIRRATLAEESGETEVAPASFRSAGPALEAIPARTPTAIPDGYVSRQWGREALRNRSEEVDDFGLDPGFEAKLRPVLDALYERYFRVEVSNIDRVPAEGRAVIVANHSGTLPLDGAMLRAALRLNHPGSRDLRWLAEDFVFYLPFLGVFLNRIGAVRACQENAERLLQKDSLVAVFPEGIQGIKKLFNQRYQLQRFGRGGYIRLCLRMRAPLVPCAIIGAEETNPLIFRFERVAEMFRLPYLPVTPTFPWLGPLGLLPAPTRWKIRFGEPISFDSYGPEAADDNVLVGKLSERVRSSIQSLIDAGLRERKSVWFG